MVFKEAHSYKIAETRTIFSRREWVVISLVLCIFFPNGGWTLIRYILVSGEARMILKDCSTSLQGLESFLVLPAISFVGLGNLNSLSDPYFPDL